MAISTVDVYRSQYIGKKDREDARSELAEAKYASKLGFIIKDIDADFLEAKSISLTKAFDSAAATVESAHVKKNEEITRQQDVITDLENRLWKLHGDKERIKDYIVLREKYSEEINKLRNLQYPRRYVTQHDHAFASSYMNLTADPDAGFQHGAPIYILKQRPNIEDMIVGNIKQHITVEVAPPVKSEIPAVAPIPVVLRKKKTLKLKRTSE